MLTIQFGQCGNQLGDELFGKISKDIESRNSGLSFEGNYDYGEKSCERWFSGVSKKSGKRIARAILVDTERKVIEKIRGRESSRNGWEYSGKTCIWERGGGGSGNNWACGYNAGGKALEDPVFEAVRSATESSDRLDGFLGLLGSGGGTGSGVGTRLLEILREEYSTKALIVALVLPFATGEIATQCYNSLFTIGKCSDVVDAIVLLENDKLLARVESASANRPRDRARTGQARFFQDMNRVASEKLAGIFQPVKNIRNETNYVSTKMAPHPGYKLVTVKCAVPLKFTSRTSDESSSGGASTSHPRERGSFEWQVHLNELRRALRLFGGPAGNSRSGASSSARNSSAESPRCAYRRSVGNVLITRGYSKRDSSAATAATAAASGSDDDPMNLQFFSADRLYPNWIPSARRFTYLNEKRRLLEREKFVALITNNSEIREPLNGLVTKAWNCYTHSAFLHRYKEFGLEDDDFLRAFGKVENIVKTYGELDVK